MLSYRFMPMNLEKNIKCFHECRWYMRKEKKASRTSALP